MTLVFERLQAKFFANLPPGLNSTNPMNWSKETFNETLGPDFYRPLVASHIILNMEYSLLGQQIRANLRAEHAVTEKHLVDQLNSAIFLAELMEHIYQDYLIVPREVTRFRSQKQSYKEIRAEIYHSSLIAKEGFVNSPSFTQIVRGKAADINPYRLLFLRSKRSLDLIAALDSSAYWYRNVMKNFDTTVDPLLPYLSWLFFMPRLSVNLYLLLKHTIPGPWMGEKEADLGWWTNLQGQLQRRWFELGNDLAWFGVGFVNCFFLAAPAAAYLSIAFFGYDVVLSALRVYIELNRLYELRKQYQAMANADNKEEIEQQLNAINKQIEFEWLRFGSHLIITTATFLAVCCSAPVFAASSVIPLAGALSLVLITLAIFALATMVEKARPKDIIEIPQGGIHQLGFFAKKPIPPEPAPKENELLPDNGCFS